MSGFGYGIGSFMEGLASGIRNGQAISNNIDARALDERRLKIQEDAAARDASNDAYNRSVNEKKMKWTEEDRAKNAENEKADRAWQEKQHGWTEQDRARQEADRAANAPLVETTRKAAILEQEGNLKSAQTEADVRKMGDQAKSDYEGTKSKSIILGKDEAGNQTYSVDGEKVASKEEAEKLYEQRHGSFTENYYTNIAPKIVESYVANGQPEKAEQFKKFIDAEQGRKTVEIGGRIMQSYLLGDMDSVNKGINQLVRGGKYMVTDGYDIKTEPLKDKNGATIGLRGVFKNKQTGETFNKDYAGDQLTEMIAGLSNPSVIFEHGLQSAAAQRAQAAKEREKGIDTGADIMKKQAELGDPNALRKELYDKMIQNGRIKPGMTPQQVGEIVNQEYDAIFGKNAGKSVLPGAGGGIPTMTWGPGR